jgi:hypothetical protein
MTTRDELEDGSLCALCGRRKPLTFHHLIPRTCHKNKWFKKRFSRTEMSHRGINVCDDCHDHIHTLFSEKELGRHFNTLESLAANEDMVRFVGWVQRQP